MRRIGDSFYFNPGSVGLAYSHQQADDNFRADPWAEYAVLTLGSASLGLEFRRVPFDTMQLVQAYRESGRPYADEAISQYEGHNQLVVCPDAAGIAAMTRRYLTATWIDPRQEIRPSTIHI